ncbi:hypothetical protein FPV67DRAFT_1474216 [Lyophyllum atratum]|nr:hypothetical protein FPV67DRAFT_1474216 [Lyophyllum atratum]
MLFKYTVVPLLACMAGSALAAPRPLMVRHFPSSSSPIVGHPLMSMCLYRLAETQRPVTVLLQPTTQATTPPSPPPP